jgi:c-di-GMP-binding flagellar brake protein YcgR
MLEEEAFQANDRVIVRAVQAGKAIGFQSTISAVVEAPVRLLFLVQPSDLEVMNLRKADRIGLFVPVDIRHSTGQDSQADTLLLKGNMLDLSSGGCRIYTRRSIPAKTVVNLSFHLPGEKRLFAISGAVIDSYHQNVVFGQRVKFFSQEKNLDDLHEIRQWIQQNLDFSDLSL